MAMEPDTNYQENKDKQIAPTAQRDAASDDDEPPKPRARKEGKKYLKTTEDQGSSPFENAAKIVSYILIVITFPISIFLCFIVVREHMRAIFFRLGRVRKGARGPGVIFYLPCMDTYGLVDLRTRVEVIPTQEMLTKDSVTISVDAVLFYFIERSIHATLQIANVHESTMFIAQTTLRNIVGSKTLHELLTSRESLSEEIGIAVDHATEKWGVRIERVALKDINLPESLQRTLASEAESMREARAKIISAEGEANASKAIKEASDVMATNHITLQLRHLQILTSIAQERRLTVVYPFPMEMMTPFESGGGQKRMPEQDDYLIQNRFSAIVASIFDTFKKVDPEPGPSEEQPKPTEGESKKSPEEPQNQTEEQPKSSHEQPKASDPQPKSSDLQPQPTQPPKSSGKKVDGGTQTDFPDY